MCMVHNSCDFVIAYDYSALSQDFKLQVICVTDWKWHAYKEAICMV